MSAPWAATSSEETTPTGTLAIPPATTGTVCAVAAWAGRARCEVARDPCADSLDPLARSGRLVPFLEEHRMLEELGGWLGDAMPLRGQKLVCYHKNWIYFTTLFGLRVVDYVEPKPGIPPTARHVAELVQRIEDEEIRVLLTANYFERRKPELIAERTGIVPVVVPMYVRGEPGVETYFDLVDLWVGRLKDAFGVSGETAEHVHHEKEDHDDVHHRD